LAIVGLTAVQRALNRPAPSPGGEIDEIRDVTGCDAKAKPMTLNCDTVQELRVGPHRGHSSHFIYDNFGRRCSAQHGQKGESRIVATAFVDRRDTAFSNQPTEQAGGQ
jgi:hypothetical protein